MRDGYREQRLFVRLDGRSAARLSVFKLPEANTVAVVDEVNRRIDNLRDSGFIPEHIQYDTTRDAAFFIRGSLQAVTTAAVIGAVLAMLVVLLFLGSLRKAFVIGLSIPIALMATFTLLGLGGLTLNVMSLGGLALGVGLLLDNAIVMLESISRRQRESDQPQSLAPAHQGASEVASAITASTMTNLAAVLPFLLMSGMAALVFRELILTISFAILASLAAALTVVPSLAARLYRLPWQSGLNRSPPFRLFERALAWLTERYRRLLAQVLKLRWIPVLGVVALLLISLRVGDELGSEFLPQVDDGQLSVRMVLPPGTPPEQNSDAARKIEQTIAEMPHIENIFAMAGGHLSGGVISERPGTANIAIRLQPAAQRPDWPAGRWAAQLQDKLDALDLPGARLNVRLPRIQGLQFTTSGTDLSIGVVGDQLDVLQEIGREVVGRLQDIDGLEGVEIGREDRSPLVRILIDRERASALGLSVAEIGEAIRSAVAGAVPTRFTTGVTEYDIRVRLPREAVADSETLGRMVILRQDGQPVTLRDVADFVLGEGPAHIERENQIRILRVNGDINTEINDVGSVMQVVQQRLSDMDIPDQYSLLYQGQFETIEENRREMRDVILLAVFLVFVVLAVQYERLANPLVILTTAPLALIGVIAMLWATSTPVSAPALLGVILLVGIVVNNAILLVEYIEQARQRGLESLDAVIEAAGIRLRPILMTTLTTVFGMMPLALGMGAGADMMRPLALAVVGGLSAATLLTLFIVPCLYLIADNTASGIKRRFTTAG